MFKYAIFVITLTLTNPLWANDTDSIKTTIERQIEAFKSNDFELAFQFASPLLQYKFGTSKNFATMVRKGYPMVLRPKRIIFLEQNNFGNGIAQILHIIDEHGKAHYLQYYMIKIGDIWKIARVTFLPPSDFSV